MAKCPTRIRVNGYNWSLHTDRKHWEDLGHDGASGITFSRSRTMTVQPGEMEPQLEASTVLHEVLHAVWMESFVNTEKRRSHESTVSGIEMAVYTMIRDNPKLIDYLQHPEPL